MPKRKTKLPHLDWKNGNRRTVAEIALRHYVAAKSENFQDVECCTDAQDLITDLLHLIAAKEGYSNAVYKHGVALTHFNAEYGNPEEE